jgi:hypothetical protein
MNYVERENDTFANRYYWYFDADPNTGSIDAKKKDALDGYDRVYEVRKWMKFQNVHYRVTFEKKPFSPIGEVGWNPSEDCYGIAYDIYLHDALYGYYKTSYKFDRHDAIYTVRKGPKKWTRNYASALLKGLGYELV